MNEERQDIGRDEHDNPTVGQTVRFDPHGDPLNPTPSGDDPYEAVVEGTEILSRREEKTLRQMHEDPTGEKGPSYEHAPEGPEVNPSGSTDPNDSLSHADYVTERIPEQP